MRRRKAEGGRLAVRRGPAEAGQALLLLVAAMAAVLVGAFVLGAVARGVGAEGRDQRAADLGALAGARAMRTAYDRLFEPPTIAGHPNPRHLERNAYLELGRAAATRGARINGARAVEVSFPDARSFAPVRVAVTVRDPAVVELHGRRRALALRARAERRAPRPRAAARWAGRRAADTPARSPTGRACPWRLMDCARWG